MKGYIVISHYNREMEKIGQAKSFEDAFKIMEEDFRATAIDWGYGVNKENHIVGDDNVDGVLGDDFAFIDDNKGDRCDWSIFEINLN